VTTIYVDDMARKLAADDGRDWNTLAPDMRRSYYDAAYDRWDAAARRFRPRAPVQGDLLELLEVGAWP
jgi:hypothetical protein